MRLVDLVNVIIDIREGANYDGQPVYILDGEVFFTYCVEMNSLENHIYIHDRNKDILGLIVSEIKTC